MSEPFFNKLEFNGESLILGPSFFFYFYFNRPLSIVHHVGYATGYSMSNLQGMKRVSYIPGSLKGVP